MYAVFDTETTGKWNYKVGYADETQPHLVQLAAGLYTKDHDEVLSMNVLIYPFDWTISEEVSVIHGITHEMAVERGIGLSQALDVLDGVFKLADTVVAHNMEFDSNILKRAVKYVQSRGSLCGLHIIDKLSSGNNEARCTMRAATPLVGILHKRPKHNRDFKYASLSETYQYFFNEGFDGAHNAINDVRACAKVYAKLCEHYKMEPCAS